MDQAFATLSAALYEAASHDDYAGAIAAACYSEQLAQMRALHEREIEIRTKNAGDAHAQKRALFLERFYRKERLAASEERRDLWQQRSEATQTLMIVTAVFFVCAYSLVVDGIAQWEAVVREHPTISVVFGIFASASLFLLLVAFSLCLLLHSRMGSYSQIRYYNFCSDDCGGPHATFSSFYHHHCSPLERALHGFFYAGAGSALAGLITYQLPKHAYVYKHPEAAVAFIAVILVGIAWPVVASYVWPHRTWATAANPALRTQ